MSRMHFGRAAPISFRRFPSLVCYNLLGKTVRVPEDLHGKLNVLVVGFKASHYKGMNSWMPFANRLKRELRAKQELEEHPIHVYRLVIRQRGGVLFRWWTDERLRLAVGDGSVENGEIDPGQVKTNDQKRFVDVSNTVRGPAKTTIKTVHGPSDSSLSAERAPEELRASKLQSVRSRTLVCFTKKSAFVEALQLADSQRVYVFVVSRKGEIVWCDHESYSPDKEIEIRDLLKLPVPGIHYLPQPAEDVRLLPPHEGHL